MHRKNKQQVPAGMRMPTLILLLPWVIFSCCSNNTGDLEKSDTSASALLNASLEAIGSAENRNSINTLIARATCRSPKGAYTTEVHRTNGGYSYFKQVYSYSKDSFEAVVVDQLTGYQLSDSNRRLSTEAIYVIRGHEFQHLSLEVDKRFHDFGKPVYLKLTGTGSVYQLTAKDELNQPCWIYFDAKTNLLKELHLINPSQKNDTIKTLFTQWEHIHQVLLPARISIEQGGNTFELHFDSILINSPQFKYKNISD